MLKIKILENVYLNKNLAIKPDYLIHPTVSGNKFRKLKYNLEKAQSTNVNGLLTFGGAYSNHIAATAAAGKELNMPTVGVIRGEELETHVENNPTLKYARDCGMHLEFVERSIYKNKTDPVYLQFLELVNLACICSSLVNRMSPKEFLPKRPMGLILVELKSPLSALFI